MKNPFKTNTKKIERFERDLFKLQRAVFKPETWSEQMNAAFLQLGNFGDNHLYQDVEANESRIKDLEAENKQLSQKIDMMMKHFGLKEKKVKAKTIFVKK